MLGDLVGDAARQEPLEPAETPAAHDDHIGTEVPGAVEDRLRIIARHDAHPHVRDAKLARPLSGHFGDPVAQRRDDPRRLLAALRAAEKLVHGGRHIGGIRHGRRCDMTHEMLHLGKPARFLRPAPVQQHMQHGEPGAEAPGHPGGHIDGLARGIGPVGRDKNMVDHRGAPPFSATVRRSSGTQRTVKTAETR